MINCCVVFLFFLLKSKHILIFRDFSFDLFLVIYPLVRIRALEEAFDREMRGTSEHPRMRGDGKWGWGAQDGIFTLGFPFTNIHPCIHSSTFTFS
jgi:hypothetical protein